MLLVALRLLLLTFFVLKATAIKKQKKLYDERCMGRQPLGLGPRCGENVCIRGLNSTQIEEIVQKHNIIRRLVASGKAGGAYNDQFMPKGIIPDLEWDEELAARAQKWADQCTFEHSEEDRDELGQNLARLRWGDCYKRGMLPIMNTYQIESWYREIKHFDPTAPNALSSYRSRGHHGTVGHFSQLIWGGTKKLGCGFMYYVDPFYHRRYTQLLVCNYYPAGNWIGLPVYETTDN